MKTVVIAFEDQYYEELYKLIKRLRRDRGLPGIALFGRSVRGTGGLARELPRLLRMPPGEAKILPDLVVCLGDADKPGNLVPGAAGAPGEERGAQDAWIAEFERVWLASLLRTGAIAAQDHERVRVVCMRWNKESVLIAGPDALLERAEQRGRRGAVEKLLDECVPVPGTLADDEYCVRYRTPQRCLDRVFQALEDRNYKKGRDDEDLLRDHISPDPGHRGRLLRRCPDLGRLLGVLT